MLSVLKNHSSKLQAFTGWLELYLVQERFFWFENVSGTFHSFEMWIFSLGLKLNGKDLEIILPKAKFFPSFQWENASKAIEWRKELGWECSLWRVQPAGRTVLLYSEVLGIVSRSSSFLSSWSPQSFFPWIPIIYMFWLFILPSSRVFDEPQPPSAIPRANWADFETWTNVKTHKNAKSENDTARWWYKGLQLVADGEVAVAVLAGGQSTRMGSDCPPVKGMLELDLPKARSLFELQAERLRLVQELAIQVRWKKYPYIICPIYSASEWTCLCVNNALGTDWFHNSLWI